MVLMNLVVKLSRERNINPIPSMDVENVIKQLLPLSVWNFDFFLIPQSHWGKADDRNCNYGHPKMADMKLGKNLFCRLNCFYNVF